MSTARLSLRTQSPEATERVGAALAGLLPDGVVVALRGDLAAGKTCLVRGMARAIGGGEAVHSPTFTLVNEYTGSRRLYHLDLYRLDPAEVADLGCEDLFDPPGLCAVEWCDRAGALLPARRIDITLAHAGGDRRDIEVAAGIAMPADWERVLAEAATPCPPAEDRPASP
jgi:tRNA threonylcarbamoyladenosine biosynthesis protein TsaE